MLGTTSEFQSHCVVVFNRLKILNCVQLLQYAVRIKNNKKEKTFNTNKIAQNSKSMESLFSLFVILCFLQKYKIVITINHVGCAKKQKMCLSKIINYTAGQLYMNLIFFTDPFEGLRNLKFKLTLFRAIDMERLCWQIKSKL